MRECRSRKSAWGHTGKNQSAMSGSAAEPSPEHADEQMRAATEQLRDQGWMVSPLTSTPLMFIEDNAAETTSTAEALSSSCSWSKEGCGDSSETSTFRNSWLSVV